MQSIVVEIAQEFGGTLREITGNRAAENAKA